MAKIYKENGVEVVELGEAHPQKGFSYFTRDPAVIVREERL